MKICQLGYSGFGGQGSVIFSLIEGGANSIYWAICFVGHAPLNKGYASHCSVLGVPYTFFRYKRVSLLLRWFSVFFWLRKERPDRIICHSPQFIVPCWIYSLIKKCSVVSVEHTPNEVKSLSEKVFTFLSLITADKVVVISSHYKSEVEAMYGFFAKRKRLIIIPNGVNVDKFSPRKIRLTRTEIIVGMAARFSFSKRQDVLVDMISLLQKEYSDKQIILEFAGDGEYFSEVRDRVRDLGLESLVRFRGVLSESELADWMNGLDIYLHATSSESFCISVAQAMACGKAVIASKDAGIATLSEGSGAGILVRNNPVEWVSAVIQLIGNPELTEVLGGRARRLIESFYSHRKMCQQYLDLF